MAKPVLGRGLSALLGGVPTANRPAVPLDMSSPLSPASAVSAVMASVGTASQVAISRIHPCPFQPRKDFAPEALQELADSIKAQGVIQPLLVRRKGDQFEIIAGERRWRAAQLAGLQDLPVIVRNVDDRSVLELAMIENLQRENLNPIEEALGFSELIERFQLRQEDAAAKVGRSRAAVANALRLLKLSPAVQEHIRQGRLSTGHAKVLLGLPSIVLQENAVAQVLKGSLNVRQTEVLVSGLLQEPTQSTAASKPGNATGRDANLVAIESRLRERFGTKVSIRYSQGKGALEIRFFSDDDLQRILDLIGVQID